MDETSSDDVLAMRAGQDMEAFSTLYRRHLQRVYSYLLSRVGNVHDAQDLTAQTFIAALGALPHYRPQGRFIAWLLGIARHKLHDHFRSTVSQVELSQVGPGLQASGMLEEDVIQRLRMQEITLLFEKLNPDRAEALRLRYFADLKIREVADVMEKSESAIKMLIARGLDDIRLILGIERKKIS